MGKPAPPAKKPAVAFSSFNLPLWLTYARLDLHRLFPSYNPCTTSCRFDSAQPEACPNPRCSQGKAMSQCSSLLCRSGKKLSCYQLTRTRHKQTVVECC